MLAGSIKLEMGLFEDLLFTFNLPKWVKFADLDTTLELMLSVSLHLSMAEIFPESHSPKDLLWF